MTDSLEHLRAALSDRYTVERELGRGGMAIVYLAHDRKLGRDVALKVLRRELTPAVGGERFLREIKLTAALSHPHILPLLDSGRLTTAGDSTVASEILYYTMPYVEGESLRDRLNRERQLPVDDALQISREVADALSYAHAHEVIHRDIKPENILLAGGHARVADFGIARAVSEAGGETLTETGLAIGTPAYMSPEQAMGERRLDARTDIYSLGAVLYEMLVGEPPYRGATRQSILAQVISERPRGIHQQRDTVSPDIEAAVLKALEKVPGDRFKGAAQFAQALARPGGRIVAISGEQSFDAGVPSLRSQRPGRNVLLPYMVAGLSLITAAVAVVWSLGRVPTEVAETRLQLVTPPGGDPLVLSMAPDGRSVVFQAGPGRPSLWLRDLASEEAQMLPGTEEAVQPFWSPDSRSIGFFADGALKRIDVASGVVRTLARVPDPRGGAWSRDGTILFSAASIGPLYRVSADGGDVTQATALLQNQVNHRRPQFLPDNRRFLLVTLGAEAARGLYVGSLGDTAVRRVSDDQEGYRFMPPNRALFVRQGALWSQELSRDGGKTVGGPVPVARKVLVHTTREGFVALTSSTTGLIAYRTSAGEAQLQWLDRAGRSLAALGIPDDAQPRLCDLWAEGHTAALNRTVDGNTDVWMSDTERGVLRRLTSGPGVDGEAVFSPDGARVAYASDWRKNVWELYTRASDGTGTDSLLLASDENVSPADWSRDGRFILITVQDPATGYDLRALPLFGDRRLIQVAFTPFAETGGRFSPDGRWVVFSSTETGSPEIYAQPFPGPGPRVPVSVGGGSEPRWRADGRELFYLAPDNRVMAVSVSSGSTSFESGPPRALFTLPVAARYEPSPDGQRFLVVTTVSEPPPITVILNWRPPKGQ